MIRISTVMLVLSLTSAVAADHRGERRNRDVQPEAEENETYLRYGEFEPQVVADADLITKMREKGVDVHKGCTQVVQKKGDPADFVRMVFTREKCPADGSLVSPKSVYLELDTVVQSDVFAQSKIAPVAKMLGLDKVRIGWLFSPSDPHTPVGLWSEDPNTNKPTVLVYALCTRSWVAFLNPDFDFSQYCSPKSKNLELTDIHITKSLAAEFAAQAEAEPKATQQKESSYSEWGGDDRVQEPAPQYTQQTPRRRPVTYLGRVLEGPLAPYRDTRDAYGEILNHRGGVLGVGSNIQRIRQDSALMRGDTDTFYQAGRDGALLRGNFREALQYETQRATSNALNSWLNGSSSRKRGQR